MNLPGTAQIDASMGVENIFKKHKRKQERDRITDRTRVSGELSSYKHTDAVAASIAS